MKTLTLEKLNAAALARFLDYVKQHEKVWVCRRVDIARHWREHHPCKAT